jgi:uncharacterized protein (TIGR03437 family)
VLHANVFKMLTSGPRYAPIFPLIFCIAGGVSLSAQCTFAVAPASLEFPAAGATRSLRVVASDTGCSFPGGGPVYSATWLHGNGGTQNNNVSTFSIVGDANTGAARTATIMVVGQTIPVSQDAGVGQPSTPSPTISAAGIVSSASFLNSGLAPGEIVSIFGSDLGPTTLATFQLGADHVTIPTVLAATQVFFNNESAPLIFTSSGQVSAIVPYTISDSTVVRVRVEYGSTPSNTVDMPVSPSAPAFFTTASGTGPGAFLNKDNTLNSATNPAHPGDFVQLYATGGGLMSPAFSVQTLSPSVEPLPRLQLPYQVTVGGETVSATYAGGAPGEVPGLIQVNIQLPADVQKGNSVPVVLKVGSGVSPAATVAIQ